jgi:hypothetical protein
MAVWLAGLPVFAAPPDVITLDWAGLRKQMDTRHYKNNWVQIRMTSGPAVTAPFLRTEEDAVIVRASRATTQWNTGDEARIPSDAIASVHPSGKKGHKGMLGAVVGAGGGFAAGAGVAANSYEVTTAGALLIIGLTVGGAVGGYFIGRMGNHPEPEYRLRQ